ncbi:MAG: cytochrome-c peroxidase [Bacteroidia bacterium]
MLRLLFISGLSFLLIAFVNETAFFKTPKGWPQPNYNFKQNPLSKEKVYLGRKLFYEPKLSKNNTISCASCHLSFTSFTHVDHALSHGIFDSIGNRNSPVLINLAWSKSFMWDGAINHLDVQGIAPIENQVEMGEKLKNVTHKLSKSEDYNEFFKSAFGDTAITGERLLKALSAFQLTLVSSNSKYDQVQDGTAKFSEQEQAGLNIFKNKCNHCHTAPLFTNHEFENNGLSIDSALNDLGRYNITKKEKDRRKFKVPTLRNIEYSFPYMHDGRFESLFEVLDHYSNGVETTKTTHNSLKNGINLGETEKVDLMAFLLTLSDKEFCFNPEFGYPRN